MIVGEPIADVAEVAVQDGSGSHAGCYRTTAGAVACWGGSNVALNFVEPQPGPWAVPLPGAAVRIVGWGGGHCAVLEDRSAWCWRGHDGLATPARVALTDVVDLAGGSEHLCAVRGDGHVWCWGGNINGQAGQAPGTPAPAPLEVPGVAEVVRVTAAAASTCARTRAGEAWCWGAYTPSHTLTTAAEVAAAFAPTRIDGLRGAQELAHAGDGLYALDAGGRLERVVRGDGGAVTVTPIAGAPSGAHGLSAGGGWACVVAAGDAWCAGPGPSARTVDATARARMTANSARAWRVEGLADVVGVSVGLVHACAVETGGALACWGSNTFGELSDGTLTSRWDRAAPVRSVVRDRVPAPRPGVYGCTTTDEQRRTCAVGGMSCLLDAPPGYWSMPPSGIDRTYDTEYQEQVLRTLSARGVPGCMCTCDEAYRRARQELEERLQRDGPVP